MAITRNNILNWTELKASVTLTFILFNFLTNTKFSTQAVVFKRKTNFRNEKPLRYNPVFVITEFDINNFEIQCNIWEMFRNG